jgi:hypothetical protein
MSCCGKKRQQWQQLAVPREPSPASVPREPAPASFQPVLENPVKVHYNGNGTFLTKGPITGYQYLFTAKEGLMVDGRDAAMLVAGSEKLSLAGGE